MEPALVASFAVSLVAFGLLARRHGQRPAGPRDRAVEEHRRVSRLPVRMRHAGSTTPTAGPRP